MALTMAPGFVDLKLLADQRVTSVGWSVINDAVALSTELWNAEVSPLMASAVVDVPQPKEKYFMPMETELQPLDGQFDSPRPVAGRISYDRAYPILNAGWAWATNRLSRAKMTVQEASDFTSAGLRADLRFLLRHIRSSWYTNVDYTHPDDEWGNLTIGCLANGDTQEYLLRTGITTTDDHFLAQAAAIADVSDPFPTIETEINEHPQNSGDVICLVPTNLRAAVLALTAVYEVEDPDITLGTGTDRLTGSITIPFGDKLLGKHEAGVWLIEWKSAPNDYLLFYSQGAGPFIGQRQHPEPELRGLRVENANVDGNLMIARLLRSIGFAIRNRVAAGVMRIGNAAYAIPTGYQAPLPQ